MTPEEKYQEIVNSRKANAEKKPEETKPNDTNPSGVTTDPPANEKKPEPEKKPDEKKPEDGKKPEGDGKGDGKPSEDEKKEHAFAKMRLKFSRENEALKKELEALKKAMAENAPKPQAKTRKDFGDDDAAYEKYLRETIAEEAYRKAKAEFESRKSEQDGKEQFTAKLREDLEKSFSKDVADKVFRDMSDPESEMSMLITDERSEPMREAIMESSRRADLLALMQAKPQMFQQILELPPKRQAYRIYQLEDQIEAKYSQLKAKQANEKQKRERADSLPNTGTFGQGNETNKGFSGLSDTARVDRIKEELKKQRSRR